MNLTENNLYLQQIELGPMKNYIYFIGDSNSKEVAVVDPAWETDRIFEIASQQELKVKALLITHGHPDHTNGIDAMLKKLDIPVYVSKHEAEFYKPIADNIEEVDPNYEMKLGQIQIRFLHTPGHTPGSQCFYVDNKLIAGDTLFLDGCGRCDLPGGDPEEMYQTIYTKLMKLSGDTVIYPGHNYHELSEDTLKRQKKTNPYMNCEHLQNFLDIRMRGLKKK